MTPRDLYAAHAMTVLMTQYPDACRGWIAQMANDMAEVMVSDRSRDAAPALPFANNPRVFAEDEAEHARAVATPAIAMERPDSCRVLGHFEVGFHDY